MVSKWLRRAVARRMLFGVVVVLLTATVGWVGWRSDQQFAGQRVAEDREVAADLVVAAFNQRLSAVERDLDAALGRDDFEFNEAEAVVVWISGDTIRVRPEDGLRYYPYVPPRSTTPQAEVLVRAAQAGFKGRDYRAALEAYAQLEMLGSMPIGDVVGGIPAALFAHLGRMTVYERQGDDAARVGAARALEGALQAGRWPISAATYEFLDEQVRLAVPKRSAADDLLPIAEAVTWLWEQRSSDPRFPPSGRASRIFASGPALLVWRGAPDVVVAWIANRRMLDDAWMPALSRVTEPRRARVALSTPDGQAISGAIATHDRPAVRLASATTLPWTIQVTSSPDDAAVANRRRLLLAGMATLFVVICGAAWLVERTVSRELAVADLRSDFVSAVSHEFRTPLTTLCQLSEMLMRDRVTSDDDRRQYYELLHRESQRLRRLVETLLNFGRLEAGRMDFHFDDVDLGALARATIDEFSHSRQARQHRVELSADDAPIVTRADSDVLQTVLWNLLENAAKYSPDCETIWVLLRCDRAGGRVTLDVRDRGAGIPLNEQKQIFNKFVRGVGARASGVAGVGVGLAMARRIVEAHGGSISLESQPGAGSTFTVVLPLVNSQLPIPNSQTVVTAG